MRNHVLRCMYGVGYEQCWFNSEWSVMWRTGCVHAPCNVRGIFGSVSIGMIIISCNVSRFYISAVVDCHHDLCFLPLTIF